MDNNVVKKKYKTGTLINFLFDFVRFLREQKYVVIALIFFAIVLFGTTIFTPTLFIDEELSLNRNSPIDWISQGRFGIAVLDFFITLNSGRFTPVLSDILGILLLCMASLISCYNILKIYQGFINRFSLFVYCAFYISLPFVVAEWISFSMFAIEVSIGIIAVELSISCLFIFIKETQKKMLIYSAIFLFIGISMYQAILTLYITYIAAYSFIYIVDKNKQDIQPKDIYKNIMIASIVAFCSLASYLFLNLICNMFVMSDSGYLSNYIGWGKASVLYTLFIAFANVARILFAISIYGVDIYGGATIRITTIIYIILSIIIFIKSKKKLYVFIFSIGLILSPFIMTIILGAYRTPGRMFVALPSFMAITWFLLINYSKSYLSTTKYKMFIYKTITFGCLLILFIQARYNNQLFFGNYLRYTNDVAITNHLIYDIRKLDEGYSQKALVFIGKYSYDYSVQVIKQIGSANGASFFEHDDGNIHRIIAFIKASGYSVVSPDVSQIDKGLNISMNMPSWPQENSIQVLDDIIVIKFSDPTDKWYDINHVIKPDFPKSP